MATLPRLPRQSGAGNPHPAPRTGPGTMTTRDTEKPSSTEQDHEHNAGVAGWIGVGAVTLGTFTLVTNEFIPVGLLTNIAKELDVSLGVAGTTVTVPGLVAAAAAARHGSGREYG